MGDAQAVRHLTDAFVASPVHHVLRGAFTHAIFALSTDWPEELAKVFEDRSASRFSKMAKGKLIEGFSLFATFTDAMRHWLTKTARHDPDFVARTAAVEALIRHRALDDDLYAFLFDPNTPGPGGRRRDSEAGVLSAIGRSILAEFAGGGAPHPRKLEHVVTMMCDSDVYELATKATIKALYDLAPNDALRALEDINTRSQGRRTKALEHQLDQLRSYLDMIDRQIESARIFAKDRAKQLIDAYTQLTSDDREQGATTMETVVLATANEREAAVVVDALRESTERLGGKLDVVLDAILPRQKGLMPGPDGPRVAFMVRADETGPLEAGDLFRRVVDVLRPKYLFFVGCAALLDERRTPEPDLVFVARTAIDADKRELAPDGAVYDMSQHHGDVSILRNIEALKDAGAFAPLKVETRRQFVSSSAFARARETELRRDVVEKFPPDAAVLEMEAFAVFKALFTHRAEGVDVGVGVIKGISDLGDAHAQTNKEETQRTATKNAMQVVATLLERLP